ncbi:unnamed protein product [Cylicostephanus goldi]|uniref:Uncharacterized protein n=1 Tax=Cylicostephanus goldi TaxID=71465 RepID=A0A3P7QEM6_CYLGO|nr:unnamed protein product [Cylicostephanus goldi]
MCFPQDQKLPPVQRKQNYDNITFANATVSPSLETVQKPFLKESYPNETVPYTFGESFWKAARREEFTKLRRFHFGREVPIAGICMCVMFDCALIALTCAILNYEESDDQEVDVFESFEDLHGRLVREAQTQTVTENPKIQMEKSVQTISPEERRAAKVKFHPRQSDC